MRRIVFYLVFDPDGHVGDYVLHNLQKLRAHAEHIFVVSNSALTAQSHERLAAVADTVWERENRGFDVWGYKEAMEQFGLEALRSFDEVVLMNYTFYGPLESYDELFTQAEARDVDFWGVTDHAEIRPNPYTHTGVMHRHIQSHWIAARQSLVRSNDWAQYWAEMPPIESYADSVQFHEARLTNHFEERGYRSWTAFPEANYPVDHPVFELADVLIDDGCPIVKRRFFFHDPIYLDDRAIIGRRVRERIEQSSFPEEYFWNDIARSSKPRILSTNASLLEIMPDVDLGGEPLDQMKICVLVHAFYPEMIEEILDHANTLPVPFDLVVTTTDEHKRAQLTESLARLGRHDADVRIVESNRGRDITAFLLACNDVLTSGSYDLVVKLHSKKSPQDGFNAGRHFKEHLFENLLGSKGYTSNLVRLFAQHPSLGIVFPPTIHIGFPTMGRAWFANEEPAKELAKKLGITIPFDEASPLAAFGSMFIARPEALAALVNAEFTWDDFPDEGGYSDGSLAHVVERLFAYAALADGFHARTVLTSRNAAISHTLLEYKLQAITERIPGSTREQIELMRSGPILGNMLTRMKHAANRSPVAAKTLKPAYVSARWVFRKIRRS
ncbi:rhamnan synthesis F family protein [Humidisolicoccus flavus]|uniref:rhamnan synthesis F family protein n=1 Tax=Humidisolicoccus flavus TaxID=3111414 RepID=UPI003245FE97